MSKLSYSYYPGCSGQGTSSEYEKSCQAMCSALSIKLKEVADWNCCGSTPAHTVDPYLSAALSARNLEMAEGNKLPTLITPCPSCLSNLRHAWAKMKDKEKHAKINKLLSRPCANTVEPQSVLQAIYEDLGPEGIKEKTVKPLAGLKVVPYYGCIMNRPPELMNFDDPENPIAMDTLLEAAGAEVLPFPLKVECCGAAFGVPKPDMVRTLTGRLLDMASELGADVVAVACPLCQMNLDLRQSQAKKVRTTKNPLPVLYFSQLLALALGVDEKELGLDKLVVNPKPVLEKINRPEPEEKETKKAKPSIKKDEQKA